MPATVCPGVACHHVRLAAVTAAVAMEVSGPGVCGTAHELYDHYTSARCSNEPVVDLFCAVLGSLG
jgi:hypothetical protein